MTRRMRAQPDINENKNGVGSVGFTIPDDVMDGTRVETLSEIASTSKSPEEKKERTRLYKKATRKPYVNKTGRKRSPGAGTVVGTPQTRDPKEQAQKRRAALELKERRKELREKQRAVKLAHKKKLEHSERSKVGMTGKKLKKIPNPTADQNESMLVPREPTVKAEAGVTQDGVSTFALNQAQQSARVEAMMLRNIHDHDQLSVLLDIPLKKVPALMRLVHVRWDMAGNISRREQTRGELVKKLELLEGELWVTYQNETSTPSKLATAKQLMLVLEKIAPLRGITNSFLDKEDHTSSEDFKLKMQKSRALKEMATRFAELVEENKDADKRKGGAREGE